MRTTITRRNFLQRTSLGLVLSVLTSAAKGSAANQGAKPRLRGKRLHREIWVATISQNRMETKDYEQMIRKMLSRMEKVVPYQPDMICLPEVFPFDNLSSDRPKVSEVAEVPIGDISRPFVEFARKNHYYVVWPIYTREGGHYYNSAVLFDN